MIGIGFTELVVILLVALLLFGPEHLPVIARRLGEVVRDLKDAYNTVIPEQRNAQGELHSTADRKPPGSQSLFNNPPQA